jgi:DNA-binding protein HU
MNKEDLIKNVTHQTNNPPQVVREILNYILADIAEELKNQGNCILPDFGQFKIKHIPARRAKLPNSEETIIVPCHNKVSFTSAKNMFNYKQRYGL